MGELLGHRDECAGLDRLVADVLADSSRVLVLAPGTAVRQRSADAIEQLTEQKALIARLARDGLSNPEIGARLFISARTVEWHLRTVFAKLAVSSRRQPQLTLADRDGPIVTGYFVAAGRALTCGEDGA